MTSVGETVFWGSSGHARVLREALAPTGVRLLAVFDNDVEARSPFDDAPIFHGEEGFRQWRKTVDRQIGFLVAIGGHRGLDRLKIHARSINGFIAGVVDGAGPYFSAAVAV